MHSHPARPLVACITTLPPPPSLYEKHEFSEIADSISEKHDWSVRAHQHEPTRLRTLIKRL
ncbi:hypothetical protein DA2_2746 [Desulfovibrio sp. A2]|nr:hypothetical protein DA2_2746 [Desulfovibrio sp. A2]